MVLLPDTSSQEYTQSGISDVVKAEPMVLMAGLSLGIVLSLFGLSGDSLGRVNILYLLGVFAFIPVVSVVLSLSTFFYGKGFSLTHVLAYFPMQHLQFTLGKIRYQRIPMEKNWFFLQSQIAALAYAVGCVLIFFLLLLVTDLHFVWRSTLLQPEQLLPMLTLLAKPWWFWEAAQPSLELLNATQDSRLTPSYGTSTAFSAWWPFILAMQVFYTVLVRWLLYLFFRFKLSRQLIKNQVATVAKSVSSVSGQASNKIMHIVRTLPNEVSLVNWAQLTNDLIEQLSTVQVVAQLDIHPGSADDVLSQVQFSGPQLVIVKAWEPPMGELADYLSSGQGYLFPIELQGSKPGPEIVMPKDNHLAEWCRFVEGLSDWKVYQPDMPTKGEL